MTIERKAAVSVTTEPAVALIPEAAKAVEEAKDMLTVAMSFAIASNDDFLAANADLKAIKAKYKEIEGKRKELKEPIIEAGRRIDDMFRPALDTLAEAERACKKSMGAWQDEQDRIRRAAEAKARAEIEAAERARIKAMQKGDEKALAKAEDKIAVAAASVAAVPETPKARGFYQVEVWSCEIVDESKIPREFLMPDVQKLNGVAKSLMEKFNVPGCKPVMTKTQGSRG